jgi:hypothetical protein
LATFLPSPLNRAALPFNADSCRSLAEASICEAIWVPLSELKALVPHLLNWMGQQGVESGCSLPATPVGQISFFDVAVQASQDF